MNVPGLLLEKIAQLEPPTVIAVSGFGGAGKSSFAAALGSKISAPVVGLDAFIIDRSLARYTHWEIVDFVRLEREVLRPFVEGKSLRYRQFDWGKNRVDKSRELPAAKTIIVEGVGLFRPSLRRYFSLMVWVDCPLHEAIRRGKQRDQDAHDGSWDGVWKENDEQCFDEYRPKEIAHLVIDNSPPETGRTDAL